MSLRQYLQTLERSGKLRRVSAPVSLSYEAAGILKTLEPEAALFDRVSGSSYPVAGNLFCSKAAFADYFGIPASEIIPTLLRAIQSARPARSWTRRPARRWSICSRTWISCPSCCHCDGDGGSYISSGVVIARHPVYGQNVDFHRCMQFSKTEMAMRVVRGRHFDAYPAGAGRRWMWRCASATRPTCWRLRRPRWRSASTSWRSPTPSSRCRWSRPRRSTCCVPAEGEFVLEGTVYLDRRHAEGPFVDLTETYDVVRQEPVFVVKAITHRKDAIWHALLPGALEHKLLMGMPREPTIFKKVNEVVRCLDVNVNPGGCSWLHAIVQIDKQARG